MTDRGLLAAACLAFILLCPALMATAAEERGPASGRAAQYLLSITPQNATQKVDTSVSPCSAIYGFQVQNTGDTNLPACNLQLFPWNFAPGTWSYNFIPSCPFSVYPGETNTVLLVIYPAQNAEAKRYTFLLQGSVASPTNTININLDIGQHAGVEVRAPPAKDGLPGETLEFNFEIVNTGNGKDSFGYGANNNTVDVLPGGSVNKTVVVTLPYDLKTTEGTPGTRISFTAWSNFNTSVSASNWTFVHVSHVYDLAMGISPQNAKLSPGELAEFTVTVLNLGNGNDNITLSSRAAFDAAGWTIRLDRSWMDLSGGRQNTTKLKVVPSPGALSGNYTIEVSANSSGPEPIVRSELVTISVRPVYRFYLPQVDFTAGAPVPPGGSLHIPFNFTNNGNADDVAGLMIVELPAKWNATLGPSSYISIKRLATEQAMLNIQPSDDPVYSRAGDHLVKVRLSSSDGAFVANLTFNITVAPVYSWSVRDNGPSGAELNIFVTNRHTFFLDLANDGNTAEEISLTLGGPFASWGRLDSPLVPLAFGEKRTVMMEVVVPSTAGLEEGPYTMMLNLTSLHRPDLSTSRNFTVTIKNFDPADNRPVLQVYPPKPAMDIREGGTAQLNISVFCRREDVDNVTISYLFSPELRLKVEVLTPPGDLRPGENRTWTLRISAPSSEKDLNGVLSVRAVGDNRTAEWTQISIHIKPTPQTRAVVSMEGLGVALAIFLALGGIALGWNEAVLFALLTFMTPLYSKIRREEILDQYTRGKIHGYIIANPGEHYNSLKAQLKLKNGTLAYHLRVLEREGYVKSARDGPFKRFYPIEAAVPKRKSEFSSIQEIVLENVRASPGTTQNDLARKMGVSSQVVNYHIRSLVTAGTIRLERDGRITRCYLK